MLSLARLLQRQNRETEAIALLEESTNVFTEGWETADMIEARALLDELGK